MSARPTDPAIRRILVALDAATHSRRALESVAELAARLHAEVAGLFVEDTNLLSLAQMPFVGHVSLPTGLATRIDSNGVERELRAMASQAERDLARAAERVRVKWSFRVVRGQMANEVEAASEEADLVVVESASRPLTRHLSLDAPTRRTFARARRTTLFLRPGAWLHRPVVVRFDGTEATAAALNVAAILTAGGRGELGVLIYAEDSEEFGRLQQEAREILEGRSVVVGWHQLSEPTLRKVCGTAREFCAGLLVVASDDDLLKPEESGRLLETLDCPVLLVR
jgi:nucleotide-binding universal stress UspA family protein